MFIFHLFFFFLDMSCIKTPHEYCEFYYSGDHKGENVQSTSGAQQNENPKLD